MIEKQELTKELFSKILWTAIEHLNSYDPDEEFISNYIYQNIYEDSKLCDYLAQFMCNEEDECECSLKDYGHYLFFNQDIETDDEPSFQDIDEEDDFFKKN